MMRTSQLRFFAMINIDWRIFCSRSSYSAVGRRFAPRARKAFWPMCVQFWLVYLTIGLCAASHAQVSDTLTFDIPKARADLALIAFAEHCSETVA